ncbi:hypothetical protein EYS14_04420 [Alteromonadaceae bacterium M269]|nr:hypothetical protein EYS14_04420 [Alteromonadaceae bacterium M269]
MRTSTLLLVSATSLLLQACLSNDGKTKDIPAPPPINLNNDVKKKDIKVIPVHEQTHQVNPAAFSAPTTKSLIINGVKMQPQELPIVKGTRIFDNSVNQYAHATGDIVVVTDGAKLTPEILSTYTTSTIATNTYRLTPLQEDADLYNLYQTLKKQDTIKRVELSIFYEGLNDYQREVK